MNYSTRLRLVLQTSSAQIQCPKTLLTNNWLIRNDSSSIQAILHPDQQHKQCRKQIKNVLDDSVMKKEVAYKKQLKSSNTCYCKEKATQPTLFRRPNKCLSLEEFEQKLKNSDLLNGLLKARASLNCYCKGTQASAQHIDLSDIETFRKFQNEIDELNDILPITEQREDYEIYRDLEHEKYLKKIAEYEDQEENKYVYESEGEDDIRTIMGTVRSNPKGHSSRFIRDGLTGSDLEHFENTESYGDVDSAPDSRQLKYSKLRSKETLDTSPNTRRTKTSTGASSGYGCGSIANGSMDFQKIRKFRDDNYFETHEIDECVGTDIPEHICVHQYRLDDRLLPQAVIMDRFGKSRCIICNKPIENTPWMEKSIFTDKITRGKLKKLSKCIELGLAPHDINIGTSEKIELKIKMDDFMRFGRFIGSYKRPCNINTFALRQQKMAYWRL